eukprot:GHVS01037411.1.p1 GENE.GHVS01037411.1~~GHVS01037411.1.p1  ORF type:complete len:371 (+),score=29.76 GHVS01037411.1:109-1221(+)
MAEALVQSSISLGSLPLSSHVSPPSPVVSPTTSPSTNSNSWRRAMERSSKCRYIFLLAISYILPVVITLVLTALQMLVTPITPYLAVYPRTAEGTLGILVSCWGHWSWTHWSSNMIGWLGLCPLMLTFGFWPFVLLSGFIQLFTSFLVWCLAHAGAHAGLSGVLCGYFGFLMVSVCLDSPLRIRTIGVMALTTIIYSTMFMATFKSFSREISWESHLFGLFSGIFFSALYFLKWEHWMKNPIEAVQGKCRMRRDSNLESPHIPSLAITTTPFSPSKASTASEWVLDDAPMYETSPGYPGDVSYIGDPCVVLGKPTTLKSASNQQVSESSAEREIAGDFDGSAVAETYGLYVTNENGSTTPRNQWMSHVIR